RLVLLIELRPTGRAQILLHLHLRRGVKDLVLVVVVTIANLECGRPFLGANRDPHEVDVLRDIRAVINLLRWARRWWRRRRWRWLRRWNWQLSVERVVGDHRVVIAMPGREFRAGLLVSDAGADAGTPGQGLVAGVAADGSVRRRYRHECAARIRAVED